MNGTPAGLPKARVGVMGFFRLWLLGYTNPVRLVDELLIQVAFMHVMIRLTGRQSNFDQIVNLAGMSALVVGAFLLVWDWAWFALGGIDQYLLGFSHLAISLWALLIIVLGLKRSLGVPVWLGGLLSLLSIPVGLPFAIMFMRSPL